MTLKVGGGGMQKLNQLFGLGYISCMQKNLFSEKSWRPWAPDSLLRGPWSERGDNHSEKGVRDSEIHIFFKDLKHFGISELF